jgi:hypothetical protein
MTPPGPTDPSKTTLTGRVVTMDDDLTVHARGAIYVDAGKITAVQDAGAPAPPGFEDIAPVRLPPRRWCAPPHDAEDSTRAQGIGSASVGRRGQSPVGRTEVCAPRPLLLPCQA